MKRKERDEITKITYKKDGKLETCFAVWNESTSVKWNHKLPTEEDRWVDYMIQVLKETLEEDEWSEATLTAWDIDEDGDEVTYVVEALRCRGEIITDFIKRY